MAPAVFSSSGLLAVGIIGRDAEIDFLKRNLLA
jgi:hypothetical protein